jgi:hypothetical protein
MLRVPWAFLLIWQAFAFRTSIVKEHPHEITRKFPYYNFQRRDLDILVEEMSILDGHQYPGTGTQKGLLEEGRGHSLLNVLQVVRVFFTFLFPLN